MQMNRVVIAAYVTKKPECRYLASGTRVAHVRVGESSRYADGSGETREHTNWHSSGFTGSLPTSSWLSRRATTCTWMAGSSSASSQRVTAANCGRCTRWW